MYTPGPETEKLISPTELLFCCRQYAEKSEKHYAWRLFLHHSDQFNQLTTQDSTTQLEARAKTAN